MIINNRLLKYLKITQGDDMENSKITVKQMVLYTLFFLMMTIVMIVLLNKLQVMLILSIVSAVTISGIFTFIIYNNIKQHK